MLSNFKGMVRYTKITHLRDGRFFAVAQSRPFRCNSHFYKCEKSTAFGRTSLLTTKRKFYLSYVQKNFVVTF